MKLACLPRSKKAFMVSSPILAELFRVVFACALPRANTAGISLEVNKLRIAEARHTPLETVGVLTRKKKTRKM